MEPARDPAHGTVLTRLFPREAGNRFDGHRSALWLLGLYVALKIVMSLNSIFNTTAVAVGADGLRTDSFGPAAAQTVLMLFALTALGQLALALTAAAALIRWRSLVPFVYVVLTGEHLLRRAIVQSYSIVRAEGVAAGTYVNAFLLALLAVGLVLSLLPARFRSQS